MPPGTLALPTHVSCRWHELCRRRRLPRVTPSSQNIPVLEARSDLWAPHGDGSTLTCAVCPRRRKSGAPGLFVSLNVDDDPDKASIEVTGSQRRVISTEQREEFDMKDKELKKKVKDSFGKAPNDAWTNSPTKHDLYETYGWGEVNVLLKPLSAVITGVTSNPVILATKTLSNNSSVTATYNTDISETVTNTFESTYSSSFATTMGQEISYGIEGIGGGKTSFSFTAEFGEAHSTSYSTTVGASSGVSVTLQPNESVIATLSSFRGTVNARVTYEASLTGFVACNYNPRHKDHHFWGLGVGGVMGNHRLSLVPPLPPPTHTRASAAYPFSPLLLPALSVLPSTSPQHSHSTFSPQPKCPPLNPQGTRRR